VKVQFHWDREGQADDTTSCWLRVSSSWAGDRYGGIAIPRVGMEVLVTFLEGDPDQPLASGCLYHKEHVVPYDLLANKTRTVFKTLSSPGGGGYNELRIEDRKGAEQIYLHAQRDWDQNIEHDQKIRVGHQRHDTVEANSYTELKANEHLTVHRDRKVEVKPDDHLSVGQSQRIKIGTAQLIKAGREIHLKAGQKMVIEAGLELTLKAGGSFIKLDPGGVTVVDASVAEAEGLAVDAHRTVPQRTHQVVGGVHQAILVGAVVPAHALGGGDEHFQRRVAGAGAHAGQAGVDTVTALFHRDDGVGHAEAEVVVGVHAGLGRRIEHRLESRRTAPSASGDSPARRPARPGPFPRRKLPPWPGRPPRRARTRCRA